MGHDANDPNSLQDGDISITPTIKDGVKGLRIGIDRDYMSKDFDARIVESIDAAIKTLETLGATIVSFKMPDNLDMRSNAWWIICSKEAALANKDTFPSRKGEYGNWFAEFLEAGSGVTDDQYKSALQFREDFKKEFRKLLSEVDAQRSLRSALG